MSDQQQNRTPSDVSLEDILNKPLQATGADIPEGSYGGTLFAFGKPFWLPVSDKFKKPGQPDKRLVFEAAFGIYNKSGDLARLDYLVPVPDGGMANRKSNLYKMLKALSAGSDTIDAANGSFKAGTTLASFVGKNGVLGVKKNAKDWPQIETIAAKMDGVKYPSVDECKGLQGDSEGVPF